MEFLGEPAVKRLTHDELATIAREGGIPEDVISNLKGDFPFQFLYYY